MPAASEVLVGHAKGQIGILYRVTDCDSNLVSPAKLKILVTRPCTSTWLEVLSLAFD